MRGVWIATITMLGLVAAPAGAEAGEPLPEVAVELVAEGFNAPVFLVAPDDGSGRRFVGEQAGEIYVIDADGTRREAPFLDLRDRMVTLEQGFDERGLLGLAFHPGFADNGLFYVNYSAKLRPESTFTGRTAYTRRLSEFVVSKTDPDRADPASERVLLELDWVNRKHNGGGLAFGPDGYLYLGLGDGGGVHGVPDIYVPPPTAADDPNRHIEEIPDPSWERTLAGCPGSCASSADFPPICETNPKKCLKSMTGMPVRTRRRAEAIGHIVGQRRWVRRWRGCSRRFAVAGCRYQGHRQGSKGGRTMKAWVRNLAVGVAAVAALGLVGPAEAAYPEKPVKIIVMYSPGGSSDVVTRILARHLEPVLGQPIVIQNINGGGGAVGWQQALSANPDGYTLTLFVDSMPVMEATQAVDFTSDDFDIISVWGTMDLTVFAQKDGNYGSLGDYQKAAMGKPGEVGLAMGYGTPAQFVSKIVEDAMGADLNLVNVGGGAQKKAAVLGGHVDAGIEPMPGMAEPYRGGQFDILAVLADERLETFPDIPTAKEQGIDAVHANTYAIIAPKGVPEDRIQVIADAIANVVEKPEFLEDNAKVNFNIVYMGPEESRARIEEVRAKMLDIGQKLGF